MISYEQIPFIRLSAEKALAEGKISSEKFSQLMFLLEEVEHDHMKSEEKKLKAVQKSFFSRNQLAYT